MKGDKMRLTITTLLILMFHVSVVFANGVWNYYTHLNANIRSIAVDGALVWCGTPEGVVRYDRNSGVTTRFGENEAFTLRITMGGGGEQSVPFQ